MSCPGDPTRDAIEASGGLDGRDRQGSGGFLGIKRGHGVPCPYGSGEDLADGFRPVVKIQFGTVRE